MKACDVMTSDHLWVCSDTTDCRQVAQLMAEHSVGSIPVVDSDGRLEGIVTDRDIVCRIVAHGRSFETPIREAMSSQVHCVDSQASLSEIEDVMRKYKIRRLPVVDEGRRLKGIIAVADLARHCHGLMKEHKFAETLEEISY